MNFDKKHLWLMLAGCLIVVAGIVAMRVLRVPFGNLLYLGLLLLCPLLHLLMMRGMRHGNHGHGHDVVPGSNVEARCRQRATTVPAKNSARLKCRQNGA